MPHLQTLTLAIDMARRAWDCSGHSFHQISLQSPQREPYCAACHNIIEAETYGCRKCSGMFHKSFTELPKQIRNHFCHPQHHLTLYDRPPYSSGLFICSACRKETFSFMYYCDECGYVLDRDCRTERKFADGEHLFVLVNKVLPSLVADYESGCAKSSVSDADRIVVAKLDIEIEKLGKKKHEVEEKLSALEEKEEVQTAKLEKVRAEIEELKNKLAQHKSLSSQVNHHSTESSAPEEHIHPIVRTN